MCEKEVERDREALSRTNDCSHEPNQRFVHLMAVKSVLSTCYAVQHMFFPPLSGAFPNQSISAWLVRNYNAT